jgi:SPP1 family phage portal protein
MGTESGPGETPAWREVVAHHYGRLPVIQFAATDLKVSHITKALMTLQDAFNTAVSSNQEDVLYNVDSFLLLKGYDMARVSEKKEGAEGQAATSDWERMKQLRMLAVDEKGDAKFLSKGNDVEKVSYQIGLLRDGIHTGGSVPDITGKLLGSTGSTSGIALKLMFHGMAQTAEAMVKHLARGWRDRVTLFNRVQGLLGRAKLTDYEITVALNIPVNELDVATYIEKLRPTLSRREQLRLAPTVTDPEQVLKEKEAEEVAAGVPLAGVLSDAGGRVRTAGRRKEDGGGGRGPKDADLDGVLNER